VASPLPFRREKSDPPLSHYGYEEEEEEEEKEEEEESSLSHNGPMKEGEE
jgi:hypothetical protein